MIQRNFFPKLCQCSQRLLLSLSICLLLMACGGGADADSTPAASGNTANSSATISADIKVLMMGNSHTHFNYLPARLEAILRLAYPGKTVAVVVSPASLFLDEHLKYRPTLDLLKNQKWNAVIFQAQKYSSSGAYSYSTSEAVTLVGLARQSNALPVLYPEWPRRGIDETDRIFAQHVEIAEQAPACIAPIGQAWDMALQRHPELPLYAGDGNHSASVGAQLTAYVLFATLSGKLPSSLPDIAPSDVSPQVQSQLRLVADAAVMALSPYKYCPKDKPLL
nr:hypothetical protein [uncultured Undibacterium sp.]